MMHNEMVHILFMAFFGVATYRLSGRLRHILLPFEMLILLYVLLLFFDFFKTHSTWSADDNDTAADSITQVYQECTMVSHPSATIYQ